MKKTIKLKAEFGKVYINTRNGMYFKQTLYVSEAFESDWVQIDEKDIISFKRSIQAQKQAAVETDNVSTETKTE